MKLLVVSLAPLPFTLYRELQKSCVLDVRSLRQDVFFLAAKQPYDGVVLWAKGVPFLTAKKFVAECARRLPEMPVVVAHAPYTSPERVMLLTCGARECTTPEMNTEETALRIRLACRTHSHGSLNPLPFAHGKFSFDFILQTAFYDSTPIPLNKKETLLLNALLRRPNHTVPLQLLHDIIWDTTEPPTSNSLQVYISSLRRKIEKPLGMHLIENLKGRGYRVRTNSLSNHSKYATASGPTSAFSNNSSPV